MDQFTTELVSVGLALVGGYILRLLHVGTDKAKQQVEKRLSPDDAAWVNAFLETVDRLAENVVQDSNARIVSGLKTNGVWNVDVAASVKADAVKDVLDALGPLHEKTVGLIGPAENIIAQAVQKFVHKAKTVA